MNTATESGDQSRPLFVGRERELGVLRDRLAEALDERGGLVMVAGEAGVGKTRTLQEFLAEASARGVVVLWGSCYEDEWRPPYGPWVQALGRHVATVDPDHLSRLLGAGGIALGPLLPEVRPTLPEVTSPIPLSSGEERIRLFEAVTQLIRGLAATRPLVLVLDDLHWADGDSLHLLRYVARFLGRERVLLIGAYRDLEPELGSHHPLVDALVALRRDPGFQSLRIHGFVPAEVAEYLSRAAGEAFPRALAEAVHAETSGNPFYVGEVFHHLVEEGKIQRRVGRWSTDLSLDELGIPESVRRVVLRRLSRLSSGADEVLRAATGFSAGFEFAWLRELLDLPDDVLLDRFDEALRAGLIRVTDQSSPTARYDFSHAIVRHAIYADQNPDRRARLHRQIASRLERVYAGRGLQHAAEVATQYYASASLPDAARGVPYALAAAEQARAHAALDRAVTFLRMARDLVAEDERAARADVYRRLAIAEAEALLQDEAADTSERALAAMEEACASPRDSAEFLAVVGRLLKEGGARPALWEPLVERGLALVGAERDLTWARLALLQDHWEVLSTGLINASRWLGYDQDAVAVVRASGDEDDYARTLDPLVWRSRAETDAVMSLARAWRRPTAILRALDVVSRDLLYRHGAFQEGADRYRELLELSERYGSIVGQGEAMGQLAGTEVVFGRLELVGEMLQLTHDLVLRLGSMHRLRFVEVGWGTILAYYLDEGWSDLARLAAQFTGSAEALRSPLGLVAGAFAALGSFRTGQPAHARRFLDALTPVVSRLGPAADYLQATIVGVGAVATWELGAVQHAAAYRDLASAMMLEGVGDFPLGPHELTIARMEALLDQPSRARALFGRARAKVSESGHQPLLAILTYDEALALVRADSGDQDRISELLASARESFVAQGMGGWEQRATSLLARSAHAEDDALRKSHAPSSSPHGLTAREVEVLRLIAGGRTNKEIAAELVISVPTVERHIANIYGKIGARGRADATAYFLGHRPIA